MIWCNSKIEPIKWGYYDLNHIKINYQIFLINHHKSNKITYKNNTLYAPDHKIDNYIQLLLRITIRSKLHIVIFKKESHWKSFPYF